MISTILALAGGVLGIGSFAGVAIKVLGWFGVGFSGGGWIGQALGHLSVKLIDFVFWIAQKALTFLFGGLDRLSRDVRAATTAAVLVFLAWQFGPGDWRFWQRDLMEPHHAVTEAAPRSTPARRAARRSVVRETVDEVRSTIRSALGGAP